jgi:hypothetical protein
MSVAPVQADPFAAAAAQRAQQVVRDVKARLAEAPIGAREPIINAFTDGGEYGIDHSRQTDEYFRLPGGDSVEQHKLVDRNGGVLSHSIERYHESGADNGAGDHSELVSMAHRHMSRVVGAFCGFLGAVGINIHRGDSVVYTQQQDRWLGDRLSSHRNMERVRVYQDGVTYERSDDNGRIKLFMPGLQLEQ